MRRALLAPPLLLTLLLGAQIAGGQAAELTCDQLTDALSQNAPGTEAHARLTAEFADRCAGADLCAQLRRKIDRGITTREDLATYERECRSGTQPAAVLGCAARLRALAKEQASGTGAARREAAFIQDCPGWKILRRAAFADPILRDSETYRTPFADTLIEEEEGKAALELLRRGVIEGAADGSLRGRDPVNRAEALKIAFLACGRAVAGSSRHSFSDVADGDWFAPYVEAALEHGIVTPNRGGPFRPGDGVTRAEFAALLTRACRLPPLGVAAYADVRPTDWYGIPAGNALKMGLFDLAERRFEPGRALTRKETVVAAYRLLVFRDALPRRCPPVEGATGCLWTDPTGAVRAGGTVRGLPPEAGK